MKTIREDIQRGVFRPVYLITGSEAFLRAQAKKELVEAITGGSELNYYYGEGKGLSADKVWDFVETVPFLEPYRLALLEDTGIFSSKSEEWIRVIQEKPETSIMIFVEESIDARLSIVSLVKKTGYMAQLDTPSGVELKDWLIRRAGTLGKKMDGRTATYFVEHCFVNLTQSACELDKLAAYSQGEAITVGDIEAIGTIQLQNRVFAMIDLAAAGDVKRVMSLYKDLIALREPAQRIFVLLMKNLLRMLDLRLLVKEKGEASLNKDTARLAGVPEFAQRKTYNAALRYSPKQLEDYLNMCANLDAMSKTGRLTAEAALEMALLTITRKTPALV